MLSEMAQNKEYLRAAEDQDFTNQIKMNPFDIIFMFLILPMTAVTVGWAIIKRAGNDGKNQ